MKWPSTVLLPFLTLKCNNQCPYCINRHSPDYKLKYFELSADQWIRFINSIEGVTSVIFNGGEPALFHDFPELVSQLKPFPSISIGTNFSDLSTKQLSRIPRRPGLRIDGSFHPHCQTLQEVTKNIIHLKDLGFHVRVHLVDFPGHSPKAITYMPAFFDQDIEAFVHPFKGWYSGRYYPDESLISRSGLKGRARVLCSITRFPPIAPNGNIYFCHYFMYAQLQSGAIGHIDDRSLAFPLSMPCDHFGFCNPCDYPREVSPLPRE